MIAQLKEQLQSESKAKSLVEEIFSKQVFIFIESREPKTVAEYFKKHKTKCLSKFTNT